MGTRLKSQNTCQRCSTKFHPWTYRPDAKYCSVQCKNKRVEFLCENCGNKFLVQPNQAKNYNVRFCSRICMSAVQSKERRGAGTPWYTGGHLHSRGYRVITVYENDIKHKMLEHRYVMEQHLGRKLTRAEDVHHKDGDKLNNVTENLLVLSKSEHTKLHFAEGKPKPRGIGLKYDRDVVA